MALMDVEIKELLFMYFVIMDRSVHYCIINVLQLSGSVIVEVN